MSVAFATGFEAQQAATDNVTVTGTTSYSTAQKRTGAASLRCNPASAASGYMSQSALNGGYHHFGLYIATLPTVDRSIFGTPSLVHVRLSTTGTLKVYTNSSTLMGTSSTTLATGTWYWIGVFHQSGTSVPYLQINGVTEVTGTASSLGTPFIGCNGTEASAIDIYIDDVVCDNASFVAPSKVDFALPISDNTVTGVTDNNGVTTNIWQCVDNTPPAGVASANEAANPKVGMHFTASVNDTYSANLETYTTLGVGALDTVLSVQGVFRHGEDIATGTKTGNTTTPFITNPNHNEAGGGAFTFGNDGGAHGAESGANFWVTFFGDIVALPSVTVGTSPTLGLFRASQSRLGCVDFMGLLVVWTPATVVSVPYQSSYPQLLAQ